MVPLSLYAPVAPHVGYGQITEAVFFGLESKGLTVFITPTCFDETFEEVPPGMKSAVSRRFVTPNELLLHPPEITPRNGRNNAFFSMWETNRITKRGAANVNRAQCAIVPSEWCAAAFKSAGVTVPLYVCGLPTDMVLNRVRLSAPQHTVFGCAGKIAHGGIRKGLGQVAEAFVKAFPPGNWDVRLEVKCHPDDPAFPAIQDPRIVYHRAHWPKEKLAEWLRGLSAFVSCSRGEGWGLMQHQAACQGVPVVTSLFSSEVEYLSPETCFSVRCRPVRPTAQIYRCTGEWAEIDTESVSEHMRRVHCHPKRAAEVGLAATEKARQFTHDKFTNTLYEILDTEKLLCS